jgi:acyl-CoA thioesterase-1
MEGSKAVTDHAAGMAAALVQSIHPEKVFDFLPGMTTANLAALYGLDEAAYTAVRDDFATQTREAARDMLAGPGFAAALARLPFPPGSTVVIIGESTTDAADSWLEILDHLLRQTRPGDAINLVNAGVSGYPTTMLQRVLSAMLLRHQPGWVVFFAGANDILRYGAGAAKPLVHITETTRNLAEMRRLASSIGARLIWMTPTAYDIQRAVSYPPFQAQQIWLQDDDAHALDRVVRDLVKDQDMMVDLQETFGRPPEPGLLQADGLHPTLAGQQAIAKAFVEQLSRGK